MKTFKAWEAYAKAQGFDVEINDATPNHIVLHASATKSGIVWGEFDLAAQVSSCESLEDYICERENEAEEEAQQAHSESQYDY